MSALQSDQESVGDEAARFIADPATYFGMSRTAIDTIDRRKLGELQRAALGLRFAEHSETIPMVAKLAGRQGIKEINEVEDIVPMLFEHTMYKSYPLALLERQQFGKLTGWLDKLTSVDLGDVDASGCRSIDEWLELLTQSDLDVSNTSGTSGTMSFFPWTVHDLDVRWRIDRVMHLQEFGDEPSPDDLTRPIHYIQKINRFRKNDKADAFTCGNDEFKHRAVPKPASADLLWLAARLRWAASRDVSRIDIPETLLARRDEIERERAEEIAAEVEWLRTIEGLQGERVLWSSFPFDAYSVASERLGRGEHWSFAPGSLLLLMGGPKGRQLPDDWLQVVRDFVDIPIAQTYGMTELACLQVMCPAGRYHIKPWTIPFLLNPDTSELLPRNGVQVGRFAFFDLLPRGHWGGIMSGDEVEVDFDGLCECGATTQHIGPTIGRLSEKRGGDDKISCTATPEAYEEAMEFLSAY